MNLIFDIGNTATKIAVYDGEEKKTSLFTKQFGWDKLQEIFEPYAGKIDRSIVSTVRDTPEFIIDLATHGISEGPCSFPIKQNFLLKMHMKHPRLWVPTGLPMLQVHIFCALGEMF